MDEELEKAKAAFAKKFSELLEKNHVVFLPVDGESSRAADEVIAECLATGSRPIERGPPETIESLRRLVQRETERAEYWRSQYYLMEEWKDLYNRDVEGLNNEGDAIGGEPARGMRYYVEYFRKENERLRSLLPPEPPDTQNQACAGVG